MVVECGDGKCCCCGTNEVLVRTTLRVVLLVGWPFWCVYPGVCEGCEWCCQCNVQWGLADPSGLSCVVETSKEHKPCKVGQKIVAYQQNCAHVEAAFCAIVCATFGRFGFWVPCVELVSMTQKLELYEEIDGPGGQVSMVGDVAIEVGSKRWIDAQPKVVDQCGVGSVIPASKLRPKPTGKAIVHVSLCWPVRWEVPMKLLCLPMWIVPSQVVPSRWCSAWP